MALDYNVVFQYNNKAGGYDGVRIITAYRDQNDFQSSKVQDNLDIVKEGVDDEEAQELCSLAPDVSYVTAAIEEIFSEDGTYVGHDQARYHLNMATLGIQHHRLTRMENGLAPLPYVKVFPEGDSPKEQLITYALQNSGSDGAVDLSNITLLIFSKVITLTDI